MRVSDKFLDQIDKAIQAGPDWMPSEVDGYCEPQACISRRQAENLIADLRDARAACREALEWFDEDISWLLCGDPYCEHCKDDQKVIAKLRAVIGEEAKP